jgi:hypothetical protein
LPEFLWVASLRQLVPLDRLHVPFYKFMDAVDEFWTEERPAIGLISDFAALRSNMRHSYRSTRISLITYSWLLSVVCCPFSQTRRLHG